MRLGEDFRALAAMRSALPGLPPERDLEDALGTATKEYLKNRESASESKSLASALSTSPMHSARYSCADFPGQFHSPDRNVHFSGFFRENSDLTPTLGENYRPGQRRESIDQERRRVGPCGLLYLRGQPSEPV